MGRLMVIDIRRKALENALTNARATPAEAREVWTWFNRQFANVGRYSYSILSGMRKSVVWRRLRWETQSSIKRYMQVCYPECVEAQYREDYE